MAASMARACGGAVSGSDSGSLRSADAVVCDRADAGGLAGGGVERVKLSGAGSGHVQAASVGCEAARVGLADTEAAVSADSRDGLRWSVSIV